MEVEYRRRTATCNTGDESSKYVARSSHKFSRSRWDKHAPRSGIVCDTELSEDGELAPETDSIVEIESSKTARSCHKFSESWCDKHTPRIGIVCHAEPSEDRELVPETYSVSETDSIVEIESSKTARSCHKFLESRCDRHTPRTGVVCDAEPSEDGELAPETDSVSETDSVFERNEPINWSGTSLNENSVSTARKNQFKSSSAPMKKKRSVTNDDDTFENRPFTHHVSEMSARNEHRHRSHRDNPAYAAGRYSKSTHGHDNDDKQIHRSSDCRMLERVNTGRFSIDKAQSNTKAEMIEKVIAVEMIEKVIAAETSEKVIAAETIEKGLQTTNYILMTIFQRDDD